MGIPRGGQGGRGDKGPNSYGHSAGPYGQGGGLGIAGGGGPGGWTPAGATGGRGSIEMPNIQALGLSSGGGQSGNNPMAGLNIGALPPMNPALVAAALNQAADGSPWETYNLWHCQNQNRPDLLAFLCQNPPADHPRPDL